MSATPMPLQNPISRLILQQNLWSIISLGNSRIMTLRPKTIIFSIEIYTSRNGLLQIIEIKLCLFAFDL